MSIAGVLFDKDGTLLDYHRSWLPANKGAALVAADGDQALAERLLALGGYDAEQGVILPGSVLAAGTTAEIAALWAEALPGSELEALTARIDGVFVAAGLTDATPVTELAPLFQRLKARSLALGIATSDSLQGVMASLGRFGVLELLDFISGYDSGHGNKPGPGPLLAFCDSTGLAPAQVAVVGDNAHDLEMARSGGAGLRVGVLTGTSRRNDLEPLADNVLADITELEALLDEIAGPAGQARG